MTLLSYQILKAVADMGSFNKAAEVLGLTPSAVSHSVAALEKELGFALLVRSKAGVTLTNYGEQLLPYVNVVLNSDESLQQAISELNGLKKGKVQIAHCRNENAANMLKAMIKAELPNVTVKIGRNLGLFSYYAERGGMLVGYEKF